MLALVSQQRRLSYVSFAALRLFWFQLFAGTKAIGFALPCIINQGSSQC
jgi:hypothetical protein